MSNKANILMNAFKVFSFRRANFSASLARSLPFRPGLPKGHADAPRQVFIEVPVAGTGDVSELEAQSGVLPKPDVCASTEVGCG